MIFADFRWIGDHGIGRFAREVLRRLPHVEPLRHPLPLLHPLEPLITTALLFYKRPKVYFSPGFNPPLSSPIPLVFTIHDLIHLRFSEESTKAKKLYYQGFIRPSARHAARILAVSGHAKNEIMEWAGINEEQIQVVGNGVSSEFCPYGRIYTPGYLYLLYVGNRKPHKNLRRLLEAFACSRLGKELRLVLSGDPDQNTFEQCRRLGIESMVVFAGKIPEQDLPAYYRGALGLAFPSLYEGFGLPLLEAMASGTPVLTSNVTSLPEVAGGAAILVDPYDVESIADGLRRLVEDKALRETLRSKGLERAKLFSWDRTAELTWQVLQEAAEQE
ncbi:glycosyltransferase family 1 protein [Thermithiobacillus tepidarius DSM 3134]|uniref:glycosyltransferase family 4 protein n=1 Tax=Thermithiobacillus tepidarius TaxID=929 RepID=UPI000686B4D5|nr:glycosyltransferase family 1 protein [Thermithiobacillus tepidarius]